MTVTPEVRALLNMIALADAGAIEEQTPEEARDAYARLAALAGHEDVASTADHRVPTPAGGVPVRAYVPLGEAVGPRPVLVYFHGGGWTIGSVETHDNTCRSLANGSGTAVVSVDYRLAPEHPYPAALEDCLAALDWVVDSAGELGVDARRLALGGDSAGGNLAALIAQQRCGPGAGGSAAGRGGDGGSPGGPPIRFQLLVYPVTDLTMSHPSIDENGEGYLLTKATMTWFGRNYLGAGDDGALLVDPADPRVSPLRAPADALVGLPPALVITAEHDPLRDEGEAYAEALRAAGVEVAVTRYDGVIHGFFSLPGMIPEGKAALDEASAALRAALA